MGLWTSSTKTFGHVYGRWLTGYAWAEFCPTWPNPTRPDPTQPDPTPKRPEKYQKSYLQIFTHMEYFLSEFTQNTWYPPNILFKNVCRCVCSLRRGCKTKVCLILLEIQIIWPGQLACLLFIDIVYFFTIFFRKDIHIFWTINYLPLILNFI